MKSDEWIIGHVRPIDINMSHDNITSNSFQMSASFCWIPYQVLCQFMGVTMVISLKLQHKQNIQIISYVWNNNCINTLCCMIL